MESGEIQQGVVLASAILDATEKIGYFSEKSLLVASALIDKLYVKARKDEIDETILNYLIQACEMVRTFADKDKE